MNYQKNSGLLINSLLLLSALGATACSSPGNDPTAPADNSKHFFANSFQGLQAKIDIETSGALTLQLSHLNLTGVPTILSNVTGTCQAADTSTGIITCSATTSSNPAKIAANSTLRFLEVPGVQVYIQVEPASAAATPETHLSSGTALYETGPDCANVDGDYSYLYTNYTTFGVHRLQLSSNEFRDLDFRMKTKGTSFESVYSTDLGGGNGIHDLISNQCLTGNRILTINDSGWIPTLPILATTSGLVLIGLDTAVPANGVVSVGGLAGKHFRGVQMNHDGDAIPVNFDFGAAEADASVPVINFNSALGSVPDFGLYGLKLIAASSSTAGTPFSTVVPAANALSVTYPNPASVPGLLYGISQVVTGEQPILALAWTTPSGKTGIVLLNARRNDIVGVEEGYTITTAIEE